MGNILLRNRLTDSTNSKTKNSYFRVTTTSASIPDIVAITVTTGDNGDLVVGTGVGGVVITTVLWVTGTVVWTGVAVVTTGAVPVLNEVSLPYALDAVRWTL